VNRRRQLTSYRGHFGVDGRPVAWHAVPRKNSAVVADEVVNFARQSVVNIGRRLTRQELSFCQISPETLG
jgi:hypothetical protein